RQNVLTDKIMRGQVEPLIAFEFDMSDRALAVGNDGIYPLTNLSVIPDTVIFAGPPRNTPLNSLRSGRPVPGRQRTDWWHIANLVPQSFQTRTISDLVDNAGAMIRMSEQARAKNELRGIPAADRTQIYAILIFRLTYHREVDNRRYRAAKKVAIFMDDTGNPSVWDTELVSSFVEDAISKLPPEGDR